MGDQTLDMTQVEQLVRIFIHFIEKDSVHKKFPCIACVSSTAVQAKTLRYTLGIAQAGFESLSFRRSEL